jgi:hypothetical protein
MKTFEAPVILTTIPNEIIAGIELKVIANLATVIINYNSKQISLNWCCSYYTLDNQPFTIAPSYYKEQNTLENIYISEDGSIIVRSENELIETFGLKDSEGNQTYDEDGKPLLTRDDLMDSWSFYMKKSTEPIPLKALFESVGNRAAIENRLNNEHI